MQIIGGKSAPGLISISSAEFVSTARISNDGAIVCRVEKIQEKIRRLMEMNVPYMPKIVRIALFTKETMTRKDLANIFILTFLGMFVHYLLDMGGKTSAAVNFWKASLVLWVIVGIAYRVKLGIWHGAEHMAIAAYNRSGATSIEMMKKESPINPQCGTRMFFPMFAMLETVLVIYEAYFSNAIALAIFLVIGVECLLQIDERYGFDNLPLTRHVSYLAQKYVVTKQPGDRELNVAQAALKGLIAAHKEPPKGSFLLLDRDSI